MILEKLRRRRITFYIVGGFVRDWAGGSPDHRDIDIGVKCNVYKVHAIVGGKIVRGRHPIVKTDGCDLVPVDDLREDLRQRDFTVNAMAIDANGELIDPYGGARDATRHTFRMTRDNLFEEDPIRLARLCRLAARMGWAVDPHTAKKAVKAAVRINREDVLKHNGLRLGLEIIKSFDDAEPSRFFRMAHEYKVLPLLLPHLEQHFTDAEPSHWAAILARCDLAPAGDFGSRMAALFKDMAPGGKPGRARRSAGIARNFLTEIRWNYVARHIFPEQCRWLTETIVMAIRQQHLDLCKQNADWRALMRCAEVSFTADQLYAIRQEAFGEQISHTRQYEIRCNILREGLRKSEPKRLRLAALRFYGYGKKLANKIINGQIIPSF